MNGCHLKQNVQNRRANWSIDPLIVGAKHRAIVVQDDPSSGEKPKTKSLYRPLRYKQPETVPALTTYVGFKIKGLSLAICFLFAISLLKLFVQQAKRLSISRRHSQDMYRSSKLHMPALKTEY